ncbi:MAG: hypothetical protein ACHQQ3_05880 [Gemmatimonadales bacterium]
MRKKGPRSIPDFSHQKKAPPGPAVPLSSAPPPVTPKDRVVVPQAKPPKLGRRGS